MACWFTTLFFLNGRECKVVRGPHLTNQEKMWHMFTAFEVEQSEPGVLGAEKDKGLDSKFCVIQQIQQNLFQVLQQWLAHLSPTKKRDVGWGWGWKPLQESFGKHLHLRGGATGQIQLMQDRQANHGL